MFSLLSLSNKVFPTIFFRTFISVLSGSLLVYALSDLVSAMYVIIGRRMVLYILAFVSFSKCLFSQIISLRQPIILLVFITWSLTSFSTFPQLDNSVPKYLNDIYCWTIFPLNSNLRRRGSLGIVIHFVLSGHIIILHCFRVILKVWGSLCRLSSLLANRTASST